MQKKYRRTFALGLAALALVAAPAPVSATPTGPNTTTFEELSGAFGASTDHYDYSVTLWLNRITAGTEVWGTAQFVIDVDSNDGGSYHEQCVLDQPAAEMDPGYMQSFNLGSGFVLSGDEPLALLPDPCSLVSFTIDGHWFGYGAINKQSSVWHEEGSTCNAQTQTRHANVEVSFGFGDGPEGPIGTYDLWATNDQGYISVTTVQCH